MTPPGWLLLTLLALLEAAATGAQECPANYSYNTAMTLCHNSYTSHMSYADALSACNRDGAHLHAIQSERDSDFILSNTYPEEPGAWLGLQYNTTEADYMWSDGTLLTNNNYTNWWRQQVPTDSSKCFRIHYYLKRWYPSDCTKKREVFCVTTPAQACLGVTCSNNGSCIATGHNFTCLCAGDWTGMYCTIPPDPCISQPCYNKGICIRERNLTDNYTCSCIEGFTGSYCKTAPDPCLSEPCYNGGQCVSYGATGAFFSLTCSCPSGYTGHYCQTAATTVTAGLDGCSSVPCLNRGRCHSRNVTTAAPYRCQCAAGYSGATCEFDVCADVMCRNGGSCRISSEGKVLCVCGHGYQGELCETSVSKCGGGKCGHSTTCQTITTNTMEESSCTCMFASSGDSYLVFLLLLVGAGVVLPLLLCTSIGYLLCGHRGRHLRAQHLLEVAAVDDEDQPSSKTVPNYPPDVCSSHSNNKPIVVVI